MCSKMTEGLCKVKKLVCYTAFVYVGAKAVALPLSPSSPDGEATEDIDTEPCVYL